MKTKKTTGFRSVLGVIPARFASTRLPGKPLVKILGVPMVQRVYETAKQVLPRVIVATDDFRIQDAVKKFGGDVMMTPNTCNSGTERMAFVARKIPATYYVNIQGDEPLMSPETIRDAVELAIKKKAIATAATELKDEERSSPSAVKVVLAEDSRAIYFSRSDIPHQAHGVIDPERALKHLGIYVYPKAALMKFVSLDPTALELTEKLEQLRLVYNNIPIYVARTDHDSIGVDTPEDLDRVQKILKAS